VYVWILTLCCRFVPFILVAAHPEVRPRLGPSENGLGPGMGISGQMTQIWHIYGKVRDFLEADQAGTGRVSPFHVRNLVPFWNASGCAYELYLQYRSCSGYICLRLCFVEVIWLCWNILNRINLQNKIQDFGGSTGAIGGPRTLLPSDTTH
jgi:hypothetical protein